MSYHYEMTVIGFRIPAKRAVLALRAVNAWATDEQAIARGPWDDLTVALKAWGFHGAREDVPSGDVILPECAWLEFHGQDEDELLAVLAPHASFQLECRGEDHASWRWTASFGKLKTETGETAFCLPQVRAALRQGIEFLLSHHRDENGMYDSSHDGEAPQPGPWPAGCFDCRWVEQVQRLLADLEQVL